MECMWCYPTDGSKSDCHANCKCVCHAIDEDLYPEETWVDGYGKPTAPPEYVSEYRRA